MKTKIIAELKKNLAALDEIRNSSQVSLGVLFDPRESNTLILSSNLLIQNLLGSRHPCSLLASSVANSPQCGMLKVNIDSMIGILKSIVDLDSKDLLIDPKYIFIADSFDDFLDYAEEFCDKNQKKESGALVGVVLEDTIKNIAEKNGIERIQEVDQIISALKTKGIINKPMAKRIRSWYGVRNPALHADWKELKLDHIREAINGCRELISNYL